MGSPNSRKVIAERSEKVLLLLSRGYSQFDIIRELGVTRQTISSDMRFINKQTQKGLFGLAKETMSTMFFNCIDGINKVQKEGWRSSFGARFDNIRRTGLPYHDLFKDDNNNGEDKVGN